MTNLELNEAVARKLGWKPLPGCDLWNRGAGYHPADGCELPNFCEEIEAAWEIMEKYDIALFKTDKGHWCSYTNFGLLEEDQSEWYFCAKEEHWTGQEEKGGISVADTAPRAICLAFLEL